MQMWSGDSAASAELLPGPVPSTAPIRLRHSAGGSSHPALVTMGGAQWKSNRKNCSGTRKGADSSLFSWKRSAGCLLSKCGKAGDSTLKIGLLITHSSPPSRLEAGTSILELKGHWRRITKALFLLRRCFSWKILLKIKLRKQNQGFLEAPGVSV